MSTDPLDISDFKIPSLKGLLISTLPRKSVNTYVQKWQEFLTHQNLTDNVVPSETHYLQYLNYLRLEKKYKGTSLWCTYSKVNACHQRLFGNKLQDWPRIKLFVKGSQSGENIKKAAIFQLEELITFITNPRYDNKYWIVRKAIITVAYFGGHRSCELRALKMGNILVKQDGIEITCERAKQRGIVQESKYFIPKIASGELRRGNVCWASALKRYLRMLNIDLPHLGNMDPLFYTVRNGEKTRFAKVPMGKNILAGVGKEVAIALLKSNPKAYTGHCWRRTSATSAADNGATSLQMRSHFAWSNDEMCREYVDKSGITIRKMAYILASASTSGGNVDIGPNVNSCTIKGNEYVSKDMEMIDSEGNTKSKDAEHENHEMICPNGVTFKMTGCQDINIVYNTA